MFRVLTTLIAAVLMIAPIVEEIAKALFLLYIISKKDFDNITDGLVYGAAIGLGFGMSENIFYFVTYGTTVENWIFLRYDCSKTVVRPKCVPFVYPTTYYSLYLHYHTSWKSYLNTQMCPIFVHKWLKLKDLQKPIFGVSN